MYSRCLRLCCCVDKNHVAKSIVDGTTEVLSEEVCTLKFRRAVDHVEKRRRLRLELLYVEVLAIHMFVFVGQGWTIGERPFDRRCVVFVHYDWYDWRVAELGQ